MSLSAGKRLGPYEITALLGSGGMGEVYRARDTKLNREVAIKVLPDLFAGDPDRLARFQREAQVLASLNHPNIAIIHGLEESDGMRALVLELVEGPTLADRIAEGPVPIDEALPIARQIAEALEGAHEHGIIHRDLKPSNIKLRPDGTVKVLDFGLAKLAGPAAFDSAQAREAGHYAGHAAEVASQSPTITSPAATRMGMILGTAAYMSPEQARGKTVDRRSDIWAFGCVLYEMLTGKRTFEGEDVSDTLANVLKREPDWNALPSDIPASIHVLVRRCLEKDRKQRIGDISTAHFLMTEPASIAAAAPASAAEPAAAPQLATWQRVLLLAVGTLAVAILGGGAVWLTMRPGLPRVVRTTITPSSAATLTVGGTDRDLAITPDGSRVVYVGGNGTQLFVRALDQLEATPLAGLGTPHGLFFSPDGQWIGFFDGTNTLKKVATTGGPAVPLSRGDGGSRGGTWGMDDTIIFAANSASGLWRVSAAGGDPTVLTTPNRERGEAAHLWPEFLPGVQAVLFTILATTGGTDNAQVAVLDLRTGTQKVLLRGGSHAHYVASGHLVYAAAGTLRAVAFDLDRLEAVGTPIPVLPQVLTRSQGGADFDVAQDGTLVYVPGDVQAIARTLVWVDRQGREEPINVPVRTYTYPRLSPDGTRVALDIRDRDSDIWIWDFVRETLTRFTFDLALDYFPVWTPDGRRLVFSSSRAGARNLFWQAADGTGAVERLSESPNLQDPNAVSPDGTQFVFKELVKTGWDLMVLTNDTQRQAQPPSQGSGEPGRSPTSVRRQAQGVLSPPNHDVRPLVQTTFDEFGAEISPDGRWLAYQSNESGQDEIYVRPFPDVSGGRWQLSTGGGRQPLWARNGQEVFYLASTGALMGVRIERTASFTAGAVTKLFEGRYYGGGGGSLGRTYDVSPDGQRFLMIRLGGADQLYTAPPNLVVVQNWFEELKRLVPSR